MKKIIVPVILSICLATSVAFNVYLILNNISYKNQLSTYESEISTLEFQTNNIAKDTNKFYSKIDQLQMKLTDKENIIFDKNIEIKQLKKEITIINSSLKKLKSCNNADLRDEFIIVNNKQIINFQNSPYDLAKEFDCDIEVTHEEEWDVVKLIFDGLIIEYRVEHVNDTTLNFMMRYTITSDAYKTQKGITVNSTRDDVIKAYPCFYSENNNEIISYYSNSGKGHTFIFDNNMILQEIHFGY